MQAFLALLLGAAEVAPTAPALPESPRPKTVQQQFDAASDDAAIGKCRSAVSAFEALEKSGKVKPGTIPAAAIQVRKGQCLIGMFRTGEGEAAIEAGLPILEQSAEAFRGDIVASKNALGDAAMRRWDYAGASRAYQGALALLKGEARIGTLIKLARSSAFDGGPEPLAYAQEAIDLFSATEKPDKDALAAAYTMHARILLNQGQSQLAYARMKKALSLSGGLTSKTTLSEVSLRGDLATAAMQVGRKDDARHYLAYTGAGRIRESPFASAAIMDPPVCGEETGLRPEDTAVVEFSISEDGSVASAHAVHTRGGPSVAAAFGKAVSEWAWRPEQISKIPAFYRVLTRVELRCSNVLGRGPGLYGPLDQRFLEWAVGQLPPSLMELSNIQDRVKAVRAFADESHENGNSVKQFAALTMLAKLEITSWDKRLAYLDQAQVLASKTSIPVEAVNWLKVIRSNAEMYKDGKVSNEDLKAAQNLSLDPTIASDAIATNTLRLLSATPQLKAENKDAPNLLMAVATDERLEKHHPLRQLAWLRLANHAVQAGDRTAAQAHFANTGMTSQQCSLLGTPPALRKNGVGSDDFPLAALWMGFEGWVRLEFDIAADGKAVGTRPIVAYPPLIFIDAATGMAKDLRYETSYRPDSSVACSANQTTINFVIPSAH